MIVEDPERLHRLARRVGFGAPRLHNSGEGKDSMEFHLPDHPPVTLTRDMPSSLILGPESGIRFPPPSYDRVMTDSILRFPTAPKSRHDRPEVRAAAESAVESVDGYPDGEYRFNPNLEKYAIHYEPYSGELMDTPPEQYVRQTYEVGEAFNEALRG